MNKKNIILFAIFKLLPSKIRPNNTIKSNKTTSLSIHSRDLKFTFRNNIFRGTHRGLPPRLPLLLDGPQHHHHRHLHGLRVHAGVLQAPDIQHLRVSGATVLQADPSFCLAHVHTVADDIPTDRHLRAGPRFLASHGLQRSRYRAFSLHCLHHVHDHGNFKNIYVS